MELKYRRILYTSFIIFFLLAAPALTLYATGYRYNFKKNKVEKTGFIHVESKPKNAQITLNDKFIGTTPSKFIRLLPDNYTLSVTKDGYHSWSKKISVASNFTSFYENIVLFKNSIPANTIEGKVNILTSSPDRKKLIYSVVINSEEELRLLNLSNNSDFLIKKYPVQSFNRFEFQSWSPSENKVLLKQTIGDFNKFIIVDTQTLSTKELFDITRLNFSKVSWDSQNESILYSLRNAVLHQVNLVTSEITSLLADNIQDFYVSGENIYFVSNLINESFLNQATLDRLQITGVQKIKLPSPSEFTINSLIRNNLVLIDKKSDNLFIIDPKAFSDTQINQYVILQDKATDVWLDDNQSQLLYHSDFEIAIFNLNNNKKTLITRYGELIDQVLWYPDGNYLIFLTKNSLKAIEAGEVDFRNEVTLAALPLISKFEIDEKGDAIYLKAQIGQQQGIYKLDIQ